MNPRLHGPVWLNRHRRRTPAAGQGAPKPDYAEILVRVGEGVSHLRHLARTLSEATYADTSWDQEFRTQWVAVLRDCGAAVQDPDADVQPISDRLTRLTAQLARDDRLPRETWPSYGSLISSLRHIAVIVDDVASSRRAREA